MSVWKSDEKLLIFASLLSPSKIFFSGEVISSIRHSVSSPDKTPRSSSKNTPLRVVFSPFFAVFYLVIKTLRLILSFLPTDHYQE